MQMTSRAQELAEQAQTIKRRIARLASRDGEWDDDEIQLVQLANDLAINCQEKSEDELFAITMIRRGRESDRVHRLGRQILSCDDAA